MELGFQTPKSVENIVFHLGLYFCQILPVCAFYKASVLEVV